MSVLARLSRVSAVARAVRRLALSKANSAADMPSSVVRCSLLPDMPMSMRAPTKEDPDRLSGSSFVAGQAG